MRPDLENRIDQYLRGLEGIVFSDERLTGHRVYYLTSDGTKSDQTIVAIIKRDSRPLLLDLACDLVLARHLRQKYESVLPSQYMDQTTWNRIICSGQLDEAELLDLINLAYRLIKNRLATALELN